VFLFNFFRPRYKFLLFSNLHEVEVGPHYWELFHQRNKNLAFDAN
jgi:hypothetical protein